MSGYGRMAHKTQFWVYLEGIWALYQERVGRFAMCGVWTGLDGGGWGVGGSHGSLRGLSMPRTGIINMGKRKKDV